MPDAPRKAESKRQYDAQRERAGRRQRSLSTSGREVGPLPKVRDPRRKTRCRKSLRLLCETYLRLTFFLPWSADQLQVIADLETAILRGGLYALAMPRGSGKTALVVAAALWALLYGHRRFVALIGAEAGAATELLDAVKMEIETNDLLGEDFPEVCFPVRALEGNNNRAGGQTLGGVRTRIAWTSTRVVFPTVKGKPASGSRLYVAGITGRVRGMMAKVAGGETIRPDFAIPDDPQTDESAASLIETAKREKVLRGAVKGLAGPGRNIAMVVPCTVIAPNDLSDRLLDRDRNPQFQGRRFKLVYAFPDDEQLWDEYARLRRESLRAGGNGESARLFYRANRPAMDAGARVAWAERFDPQAEESALQAAMNLRIDDPAEFAAEYQNDPDRGKAAEVVELDGKALAARLTGVPKGQAPRECTRLTAFVDCSKTVLWYGVAGWDEGFGGSLIDYGAFPAQNRAYFTQADARPALADAYPGLADPAMLYAALKDLTADLLGRRYPRHGHADALAVELLVIDAGWLPEAAFRLCRQSPHAGLLLPSRGFAPTMSLSGVDEWPKRAGERTGPGWRLGPDRVPGRGKRVAFDTDAWKQFAADRLLTPPLARGCLMLPGDRADAHQLLCDHLTAEYATEVSARGRKWNKWLTKPGRTENHLFDVLVGCALAASVRGLAWTPDGGPARPRAKKPRSGETWAETQRRKMAERGMA
jgi:hypothetical protein